MIDEYLIKILKPLLNYFSSFFYSMGVNANYISFAGLALSFMSFVLIINGFFIVALFVFLFGRILDGIDGNLANKTSITEFGGFIDIVCDFISYSIIPLAFILNDNSNAIFGSILLTTFFGTSSTFFGIAIFENKKTKNKNSGKSFFYIGGFMGGAVTILFLSLMFLLPDKFNLIALIFSILCILSTVERIYYAFSILERN